MVKLRSPNSPPTVERYKTNYSAAFYAQHCKHNFLIIHQSVLDDVFTYWNKLVETFSDRDLTNPLDKLPAMHGLAQALHKSHIQDESFSREYFYGHWMRDLHKNLL